MNTLHAFEQDALLGFIRLLVGAYPSGEPQNRQSQRIYFANHSSNMDTLALLAALPRMERFNTRPVAAKDYWNKTKLTRHAALDVLNAILIDRKREEEGDPLAPVYTALSEGSSLIIFPEGQRNVQPLPANFKSGLFHLAEAFPQVELVPVYLENLNRIMPKGSSLPVPIISRVIFGEGLTRISHETKADFLERARQSIIHLAQKDIQKEAL